MIIYLMGVSGSGKSTVGLAISERTGIPFYDGDDFHPSKNIKKMTAGQPLNDEDRRGWLLAIREFAIHEIKNGQSLIIACSALKESYRLLIEKGMEDLVHWVYLKGSFGLIQERLQNRKGHFMPPHLLQSQFDTLEPPRDAWVVEVSGPLSDIVDYITSKINQAT